jgi:hypothetical protein
VCPGEFDEIYVGLKVKYIYLKYETISGYDYVDKIYSQNIFRRIDTYATLYGFFPFSAIIVKTELCTGL